MAHTLTRAAEGLDRRGFSLAEIERMRAVGVLDPDEKFELIDGEIVPMSPQNMPHMLWKSRLAKWLYPRLGEDVALVVEATLRLRESPALTFEPDLLIFAPEAGAGAIRPAMVKLCIEVADSSIARDQEIKAPRYAAFGVAELWIIDVLGEETRVYRSPGPQGYGDVKTHVFTDAIAPQFDPALNLRLEDLRAIYGWF